MLSTVARINSVGMRVIVQDLPSDMAISSMLRSMVKWEDLKCQQWFPQCANDEEDKPETEEETTVGDVQELD